MSDSLADQLKYFLLNGGDYHMAPNLGSDVLDRIDTYVARFLALPNEHARHTLVLWCAHCCFMDCWEHTPRLLFTSPEAGCGKLSQPPAHLPGRMPCGEPNRSSSAPKMKRSFAVE